jgi:hypothetical protein
VPECCLAFSGWRMTCLAVSAGDDDQSCGTSSLNVVPANAGTHTPCPIGKSAGIGYLLQTITAADYGSLRSQGRRLRMQFSNNAWPQTRLRDLKVAASRSRRAFRASFAVNVRPLQSEGAGNAGRRCARSRAWCVGNTRVSHHGHTGKRPAFPAQWF